MHSLSIRENLQNQSTTTNSYADQRTRNSDLKNTEKDSEMNSFNFCNFNDPICQNELILALKILKQLKDLTKYISYVFGYVFQGIKFDSKSNFNKLVDEIKERCNTRLNLIKILNSEYSSQIYPQIKIYSLQHHASGVFNKLKLPTVSNRLFELSERYVRTGLSHSIPLVVRLVEEYKEGFESRYIEYPTPLRYKQKFYCINFVLFDILKDLRLGTSGFKTA
ncbi:hypothetical protein BpHYR1_023987 [Brachionus plicatilis]|uniref:Uncharacterized protein n=1 Tax=Brachionus plicatilis TaxID=10195 RepID=A0A3M7SHE1_BRAPC|nr:hypothetical protein BpHYR1_023987 [Brachionus plicatilis]